MALTNAEKQAQYRARQQGALADQAKTITDQQTMIGALQKQVAALTAELQKAVDAKHALEIKVLKLQAGKKK